MNKILISGTISVFIAIALMLVVVFIYPLPEGESWGAMGFLLWSVIFGVAGIIALVVGLFVKIINHERSKKFD